MTNSPSTGTADLWQFEANSAKLCTTYLSGEVTLENPSAGIGQLVWNDVPLDGYVLGVSAGEPGSAGERGSPQDAFARGTDLVAVYATTGPQSFSWQVYWRAFAGEEDVVLLDAIVSFQTALLESFPRVSTQSQLSADEVWLVRSNGQSNRTDPQQFGAEPKEDRDCVVLRSSTGNWSYAEMTHPLDQGAWRLARSEDDKILMRRNLGGSFLEKGVIRRLRFRGAFLPRENDLEQAAGLFTEFAAETPPLTV
jgi:hypothetical protein